MSESRCQKVAVLVKNVPCMRVKSKEARTDFFLVTMLLYLKRFSEPKTTVNPGWTGFGSENLKKYKSKAPGPQFLALCS